MVLVPLSTKANQIMSIKEILIEPLTFDEFNLKKGERRPQRFQPRQKSRDNRQVDEAKISVGLFEQVDDAPNVIWGTMIPVNGHTDHR